MENEDSKIHKFQKLPDNVPVLYLDQIGSERMMVIAGVGIFTFEMKDSEDVAKRLDKAAAMVRRYDGTNHESTMGSQV